MPVMGLVDTKQMRARPKHHNGELTNCDSDASWDQRLPSALGIKLYPKSSEGGEEDS